ncbi:peptidoglycan DD-metalloendopeptidase family protein [Cellulophaga baltica]|uniref:peptidoglycan DD-metalloendopeptidase family protein n=1 Tax=Cellulophaga baltica TaxID=76594 RepID=UPI0024952166|nr:peptidoglycan DD-metalloendopeptidase family protein [Cellulophaga baltica]
MNTSYPDDKKEQLRFENTYGKYLMSAYNTWHGGVHLEGKNNKIHAIADGKIIAYRLNEEYEELTKTKSRTAEEGDNEAITVKGYKYSNSFILIQHDLELTIERPEDETEELTGNGEKKLVTFYSLYNHLKPINDIDNDKLDFPEFLGKKQTTVKLKEGFGEPITRKGLNGTTIVGNTKIVIPKGKIVTKYFNEDGKEEKAYNHKKEEFVRIKYIDDDATEYNDLFISTASTDIKDLGSSYQIISQVNEEKWEDKSGLTEDQKKSKPGARVRNATSGGTITAIIPFGEMVNIEEIIKVKNGKWYRIENYSGYSHETNFETKNCLDESKFTKNEIVACNIPIKANTHIGYAGLLESDSSVGYNACQLDVFMTEGVEDFINNKFKVDGNDKPFEAGINDKHFYKLSAGTKLLKSIKTTVDLQQNLPVKILEIRGNFAKIKVVDKIVRTVVVEGNIYTSDNDKGKYKGYNSTRGYHILNFFCVNQKFDGLLVENESVLVYDVKPKTGDLTRELKFVPKEAGKEYWIHASNIIEVVRKEDKELTFKVPASVWKFKDMLDYTSTDKKYKKIKTKISKYAHDIKIGDKTTLKKQISEAFVAIPENENDIDEELCHEAIIDLRKYKNPDIKDYIQVECIHLVGEIPFTQKGWIKKPTDLEKNAFSAYNWDKFGFRNFDAGNEYIYDIKGLHNFIRTDSLFISELWSKLDVTKNKNKDLIDINELRIAYKTLETQEAIAKMVCKHTLEWAYTPKQISDEVSKIYDYYISLEDPSVEGELKDLKKQKLQGLEEQVEKMMFWEELKTKVYTPPEPEPEIKERPEQVALELKALGIIDYPYKLTTANDPILNVAPVDPVENDIHAPTPDPVETVEPIETPVEEQVKAPERLMPDTNHVCHFHPIAFINHMKLIYGGKKEVDADIIFPLKSRPLNDKIGFYSGFYWADPAGGHQATFNSNRKSNKCGSWQRKHAARDLYTMAETPVVAICKGTVLRVDEFYAKTDQITILHKTDNGRKFIVRYGELAPSSIKFKKGDDVKQGQVLGLTGKLLKKNGKPIMILKGKPVYMLHFEYYTGASGFNINESLSNCTQPFTRRKDVVDPIDILKEGYTNVFEKGGAYKWAYSYFANIIAEKESNNNYNLCNKTKKVNGVRKVFVVRDVKVVETTIKEIQKKQSDKELFAVGRYQLIPDTLNLAISTLGLDVDQRLDEIMQDRIFEEYLIDKKRPQIIAYLEGNGSVQDAMHAAAKEWASIGVEKGKKISSIKVNGVYIDRVAKGGESYYSGDGLNKAHITPEKIKKALIDSKNENK